METREILKQKLIDLRKFLVANALAIGFIIITFFNFSVIAPRFYEGIPDGVDSSTHLFKTLYLSINYKTYNQVPLWCSSWYGGVPFLRLYSPLGYYVTFSVSLLGLDPILAYKIVDAFFYIITPFTIYFLTKSLRLSKEIGILAGVLFSITPLTIENFVYWDRFTTIMAIPFVCLFLGFLNKFLEESKLRDGIFAIFAGSTLVLSHHLTAYCTGVFVALLLLTHLVINRKWKPLLRAILLMFFGIGLLSTFWLISFLNASQHMLKNPFFNRSNLYNYLYPSVLTSLLNSLNTFQVLLSILAISFVLSSPLIRKHSSSHDVTILSSISLMINGFIGYSLGIDVGNILFTLGLGFFVFFYVTLLFNNGSQNKNMGLFICGLWFIVFFWLSLGINAYLFEFLPFNKKLDLLRIHIYTIIPEVILASYFIIEAIRRIRAFRIWTIKKFKIRIIQPATSLLLASIIIVSIPLGLALARSTTFFEQYRYNINIPKGMVDFFVSQPNEGRILPIECPNWVYILPCYTGKSIIDGWYPQEKLLQPLLEIDDYRINDLIITRAEKGEGEQNRIWQNLIGNASKLGISWVISGKEELGSIINVTNFQLVTNIEGIDIYRSKDEVSMVEVYPKDVVGAINFQRSSPEMMTVNLQKVNENITVTVKEAYFNGWKANEDNSRIILGPDNDGLIQFQLGKGETHSILLVYEESTPWLYSIVSITTFFALVLILILKWNWRFDDKQTCT